jgi:hypothetical protein
MEVIQRDAIIQLKTMTKKTSLFEKEVAFLQRYQIGKHVAKLIPAILNKYVCLVSIKSITAGKSKNIDKNIVKIDKNLNVGLKLIILIEKFYSLHLLLSEYKILVLYH